MCTNYDSINLQNGDASRTLLTNEKQAERNSSDLTQTSEPVSVFGNLRQSALNCFGKNTSAGQGELNLINQKQEETIAKDDGTDKSSSNRTADDARSGTVRFNGEVEMNGEVKNIDAAIKTEVNNNYMVAPKCPFSSQNR